MHTYMFTYLQWLPYQVLLLLLFNQFLHDTMENVPIGCLVFPGFMVVLVVVVVVAMCTQAKTHTNDY